MTAAMHGKGDERIERPARRSEKEGVLDGLRISDQKCSLTEVVEDERRASHGEPRPANRLRTEMTHVGVERLAAGHDQEDASENDEGERSVLEQEANGEVWAQRQEHTRDA